MFKELSMATGILLGLSFSVHASKSEVSEDRAQITPHPLAKKRIKLVRVRSPKATPLDFKETNRPFKEKLLEIREENETPFPGAIHLKENKELIQTLLEGKNTELHFFWTTGVPLDLEGAQNFQVKVGGADYGEKFPVYVEALLEVAPALKVKFVCDEMTRTSNKKWIQEINDKYQNFETLDIGDIQANLQKKLPMHQEVIESVFKNATGGNPAISSDVYRLIGMPFSRDLSKEEILNTLFVYADVDLFCAGMDMPDNKQHTNLVKALFSDITLFSSYVGCKKNDRGSTANDLIKVKISDINFYEDFCAGSLSAISKSNNYDLLTYFSDLVGHIQACEKGSVEAFDSYRTEFLVKPIIIKYITELTGPTFCRDKKEIQPIAERYPVVSSFSWHGTQLLEYTSHLGLSSDLNLWRDSKVLQSFLEKGEQYERMLNHAFFAKKLGDDHPFNVQIKKHLKDDFPYKQKAFKELTKSKYKDEAKRLGERVGDLDSWLENRLDRIAVSFLKETSVENQNYFLKLTHLLEKLGISIDFTKEDVDFRSLD